MTRIDPEIWSKLEISRPTGDELVARPAFPGITERLYCAIDSDRERHLLIPLMPEEEELQDVQSRGVVVDSLELVVQGKSPTKYIDIDCREASGYSILDLIGGEIADDLVNEKQQPADILRRVLGKWRRFWGQAPKQLMTRDEQLGLFAELWFFSSWLFPKFGPNVITSWHGPWGARNDFIWEDKSVEVKATTNSRGRIFHIHGINQLEKPEKGDLYLFAVILREEAGASNNLPELIEKCRDQLRSSGDALSYFEDGLMQAGYSPIQQDEYSKMHVSVIETLLYLVDRDFPRIVPASFSTGLPGGVEGLDYEINLDAFKHLIVASAPGQLPFEKKLVSE